MAKGSCGCCSLCGVQLPPEANGCCLCVCDTLCLKIREETEGPCDCDVAFAKILWNPAECAYVGTAACGSLSIDVRFDIKKCSDGTCRLCLTSTCLGLTGQCSTSSGCNEFSPGHNGDCGKYLKDCTQDGGWDETWNVDATGCLPPNTAFTCPSISIRATCYPRFNPAGSGLTRLCKDCDCVCECVFISWEEADCAQIDVEHACWNDSWTATLDLDEDPMVPCPGGQQTVTVEIVRDEVTGCCNWKVTITKGVFAAGYTGAGTKIALVKTECPDAEITLGVELEGDDTGIVTIYCDGCGSAINTCCACEWLAEYESRFVHNPNAGRLKATLSGVMTGYIILCPDSTDVGIPNYCLQWRATGCAGAFDNVVDPCGLLITSLDFACIDKDQGGGFGIAFAGGNADCAFSQPAVEVSANCGPPLEVVYTSEVVSTDPENPCPCLGTLTITITPLDPI